MDKLKEWLPYVIIIVVVVLIRTYIVTPVIVVGNSMKPVLEDKQILLLNKYKYRFNDIERFDIVVIKVDNGKIIKRVIGLPGEYIEYRGNELYIDGKKLDNKYNYETEDFSLSSICNCQKIPEGKYLVLGDNRKISSDSRIIGLIDKEKILGTSNYRLSLSFKPIRRIEEK